MGESFIVYDWEPNKKYLQKLLHRLEHMDSRKHWLDANYNMWGICNNPTKAQPSNEISKIPSVDVNGNQDFPNITSFTWAGEMVRIVEKKAYDFGRCKLYICEDSKYDGLFWLLYDSYSEEWFYCMSLRGTLDGFIEWIEHLL
jgi:hypothetical protein